MRRLVGRVIAIRHSRIMAHPTPVAAAWSTTRGKQSHHTPEAKEHSIEYESTYTSGHWLKHDKLQQEARYVRFNREKLWRVAINACPRATKIEHYEKKEGNFHRAFILHMDNGARVVVRLPFQVGGPKRLSTNSEVATMAYNVLAWSDDEKNPTGTEYIIMQTAPGVQLQQKWNDMNDVQHLSCVKNVAHLVVQMTKLQFPAYGSIYFADAPIDPTSKLGLVDGFCIGPHCGTQYWPCSPGEDCFYHSRKPNRGPWKDLQAFCSGLVDAGLSKIPKSTLDTELSLHEAIQEHLSLLQNSEEVIGRLIETENIKNLSLPVLLHPDLHKRNLFVSDEDPTKITGVIDWQSSSVEPMFCFANETPDLAAPFNESHSPSLANLGRKEDIERCWKAFELVIRGWFPNFHTARAMDESIIRPFRYCPTTWRDGAAVLRQDLIDLSEGWNKLGLPDSCPYQPSQKELDEHAEKFRDLITSREIKLELMRGLGLNTYGWVPSEMWGAVLDLKKAKLEDWMKDASSDMAEEEARRLWPFDID